MKSQKKSDLTPAVIYARFSSINQNELSIDGQIRECSEWAERNGFQIIKTYEDKALTGRSDRRPGFQKMIADSDRKQFQAVICWKTDRFARNRYDAAVYKARLKKNGVRLLYAKESVPEGPEGIIIESLMEGLSEYYSANLSENVMRGNYDAALRHKTLGHKVLGYRESAEGTYEIDPVEAPIVRKVFDDYEAGRRMVDIIADLNNAGYRTRFGNEYNKSSLRRILSNEKYIGTYIHKDYREEDVIPVIISKDQFARVQRRLKTKAHAPRQRNDVHFILTSKLFCGHCGSAMTGDSATGEHGQLYLYYTCRKRRIHECNKKRVKKEDIEKWICSELNKLIMDDTFVSDLADACMEYQDREPATDDRQILQARLDDVQKQIRNLTDVLALGGAVRSVVDKLTALSEQEEQLKAAIAECMIENPRLERDQIVFMLEELRNGDPADPAYQLRLIDTFLNSVYLYDDGRAIINLNYTGNNSTVSFDDISQYIEIGSTNEAEGQPSDAKTNFYIFLEGIATMEARFHAF